ncbi:FAD-binding oxidoreductase [Nocardiopsis sp. HNM0947]|uniref:FAD-binding oxidoreductase n=2 Tax=Nocardiopsis coralli TaxID=2772213 RepID=A0ABR9PA10_9ACTN|nr:FAD-binding oxidoreductase [Nocardiopsis coralli]
MTGERPGLPDTSDLRGSVLTPSDEGYEAARGIFNDRLAGHPAMIVRCADAADVRRALRWARAEGLEVSVRGGGHGLGGWASNDDGLVVDLTRMRRVLVDPGTRTAWIGGGARAGDVVSEAARHGLVPVTGVTPSVGMGGLATGAGEGYLTPLHGYASDNVLEFEVVTASGDTVQASATQRPDLYWALRGAGPNFGVVTAMRIRLHPLPEQVIGGSLTFTTADIPRATRNSWELMEHGSPFSFPQTMYARGGDGSPTVTVFPGHTGPSGVAAREIGALRAGTDPVDDTAATTYAGLLHQLDPDGDVEDEGGSRHLWDCFHLPFEGARGEQVDLVLSLLPSFGPNTMMELWPTRPAEIVGSESVIPRSRGVTLVVLGMWTDPADDAREIGIVERISDTLRSSGLVRESPSASNHVTVYTVNRVRDLYGADDFARLQRLKSLYDPDNVFRNCYNVPPGS